MRLAIVLTLGLASIAAASASVSAETAKRPQDQAISNWQSFINQHPDLLYRMRGLKAYEKARYGEALFNFKFAAKYADKAAQGMVADMLWKGEGGPVDRAQAYAWIDLAAERGYPAMLVIREKMWSQLTVSEQKQALALGEGLYEIYGDEVAKPRLEMVLVRGLRNSVTGSRIGYVGTLEISSSDRGAKNIKSGNMPTFDGEFFYQDKLWQPSEYWQWKDASWKNPAEGKVDIGPLEKPQQAPSQ